MNDCDASALMNRILELVEAIAEASTTHADPSAAESLDAARVSRLFRDVAVRVGASETIVVLDLDPALDLTALARQVDRLGPPVDFHVVSPPIAGATGSTPAPTWDRKYGLCHRIGGCPVWFGIETSGTTKRLLSISIHARRRGVDA